MIEPLTDEQLDVLVARLTYRPTLQGPESNPWLTLHNTVDGQERERFVAAAFTDVPVLLAEVTRLRAENAALRLDVETLGAEAYRLGQTARELERQLEQARAELAATEAERNCIAMALQFALAGDGWTTAYELRKGVEDILATGPATLACPCRAETVHQQGCNASN